MPSTRNATKLLDFIVDRANVGIFAINKDMDICLWNNFMEIHSGRMADEVIGKNLFIEFPELPRKWLERKINNVFILKNFSFTSWEQRPYLFKFPHNRPLTGGVDSMRQDCTLLPMKDDSGSVQYVCFTLFDVTDTSIYQVMLKDAMEQIQEASDRDGLTGLFNRRYVENTLATEFTRYQRYGGELSLILSDIDFFKQVNDTHGHLAGDEVLKIVSDRLQQGLRKPDILGRYGGEEFLIVLPETNIEGAMVLAERLRHIISNEPIIYKDTSLTITMSLGITQLRLETNNYEMMVSEADQALYQSKHGGRNQATVFSQPKLKTG